MNHVNMKHSQWGLLGLLWTLLAGVFVIILAYAIHGTFVNDNFDQLLDKMQKNSYVWFIGILELVVVVGSIVGLILLSNRISKKGTRNAVHGWIIMLGIVSAILFFSRIFTKGTLIFKEGIIHHALLLGGIESTVLIIFMIVFLIVWLARVMRSARGIFLTLFSGTFICALGFGAFMGLDYIGKERIAWIGPVIVFIIAFFIYFLRPVSTRRKSLRKDFKRLKDLITKAKKDYPNMDSGLMETKFEDARRARRFASFTGVGYERAMNKMEAAFQAVYDGLESYYANLDNDTRPIVETFGSLRSLKSDNAKITELEDDIKELESILESGKMDDAKDKALELRRNARDLRDLFDASKGFLDNASNTMERLHKLGADDPEVEDKYETAKKDFSKGKYKRARDNARFATEEGNNTADTFEKAKNLIEMLENRLNNKIDHRMFTREVEKKLEKAKYMLRGVEN